MKIFYDIYKEKYINYTLKIINLKYILPKVNNLFWLNYLFINLFS
jgi:hypothetical protein